MAMSSSVTDRFVRVDPRVLAERNIIVCAPTGTGKTTAVLRAVWDLVKNGMFSRAVFCLPTRAACEDVARSASALVGAGNVGLDTSDARLERGWSPTETWRKPIVVTTYERADSVFLSDPNLVSRSIVVIDEFHNVLMPERATSIIDLLALAKQAQSEGKPCRIAVLSATMPMLDYMRRYLDAEVITKSSRPVEIEINTVPVPVALGRGAQSYYKFRLKDLKNVLKTLTPSDTPVLIYVPHKKMCEEICKEIKKWIAGGEIVCAKPDEVVYHHAGLPKSEREKIELELKKPNPKYKIVVATDTLSQSVNLAFRTVIVAGLKLFLPDSIKYVEPATVMQVIGRAGRPGYQNVAKAYILYSNDEEDIVKSALSGMYGKIKTLGDYPALVLRLLYSGRRLDLWLNYAPFVSPEKLEKAVKVLQRLGMVSGEESLDLTPLGRLVAKEYLPSQTMPFLLLLGKRKYMEEVANLNRSIANTSLALACGLAYLLQKLWAQERTILSNEEVSSVSVPDVALPSPGEAQSCLKLTEYDSVLDLVGDRLFEAAGASWEILLSPRARTVLKILYCPDKAPADNVAEAVRKAAQALVDAAESGLIDQTYVPYLRALMKLMKSYRRILRVNPVLARKFARIFLTESGLALLASRRNIDPEALFMFMEMKKIDSLPQAVKMYLAQMGRQTRAQRERA